ncbi:MAG: putative DNA binding domain-containing protein [Candidatus Methanoplasma sp.]|jgi:ATP-dependent DNA helicase RecG|nr:putative DNA binding domain-containing protein [Candidatus Methanoplasma sp.]
MIRDLEVVLSEGESHTAEFKRSPDKSLASEACAFANASGGRIFIGVGDGGEIVGTDTGNAARSKIQDTVNKIDPPLDIRMDVCGNMIVLTVPEGRDKPYCCPSGFYMRFGPNSQKLDRNAIFSFLNDEGLTHYDDIVRRDLPVSDRFDEAAYKRYLKLADIDESLGREPILVNLGAAERAGGELFFTNAGALFFRKNGEDMALRHANVVCALYKGTDKVHILDAKVLDGDVVSNIDDAVIFLKKHLRLRFVIKTLRREEILELPEDALREAVVNAACHRDYFERGANVMVEVFDDRVEITNPGGACKGITAENFGSISIARNPVVAAMLHRISYIEKMGTGIRRIRDTARAAGVAEPEFELTGFFKTTFRRTGADGEPIGRQSAANRSPISMGERKLKVLSHLEKQVRATSTEFASLLGISDGRVRSLLRDMASEGSIEKVGGGRYAHYVLAVRGQSVANRSPIGRQSAANRPSAGDGAGAPPADRRAAVEAFLSDRGKATAAELRPILGLSDGRVRSLLRDMASEGSIEKVGGGRYAHYVLREKR